MTLPARAAALRGDDYQHIIGWYWACRALTDVDLVSVSIEDASGGAFDDLVVLRNTGADCYYQVKSSNSDETVVDAKWLTTATATNGKSPLQHFHATWAEHRHDNPRPQFQLITNRAFDPDDPILKLHDKYSNTVGRVLRAKTARSLAGRQRKLWANHLGITEAELLDFLDEFELHHEGGETSWSRQARDAMRAAGLRDDDDAVLRGRNLVRDWVKTGAGPQTRDAIREQVAQVDLLARQGTLIFAVHAIDRPAHSLQPVVTYDFVDLYEGATDRERRQLRNPDDWQTVVMPSLAAKIRDLEAFGVRRVHITGAMRLPMWFATGVRLPDIRGWVVSADQRSVEWCSDALPAAVEAQELGRVELGQGQDLAVAIALTHDVTTDVEQYLRLRGLPVSELLALGPAGGPSQTAVTDAAFAVGWAHAARARIVAAVRRRRAPRLHLFFAAPAGAALMLGHHWNLLPPTTVYEHLGTTYAQAMTIR
ncbi:SAVED domain-containing protein [Micromonospora chalcea]